MDDVPEKTPVFGTYLQYLRRQDADIPATLKLLLEGKIDGVDEYVDKEGNLINAR